jgi:hypothetical protein
MNIKLNDFFLLFKFVNQNHFQILYNEFTHINNFKSTWTQVKMSHTKSLFKFYILSVGDIVNLVKLPDLAPAVAGTVAAA